MRIETLNYNKCCVPLQKVKLYLIVFIFFVPYSFLNFFSPFVITEVIKVLHQTTELIELAENDWKIILNRLFEIISINLSQLGIACSDRKHIMSMILPFQVELSCGAHDCCCCY